MTANRTSTLREGVVCRYKLSGLFEPEFFFVVQRNREALTAKDELLERISSKRRELAAPPSVAQVRVSGNALAATKTIEAQTLFKYAISY